MRVADESGSTDEWVGGRDLTRWPTRLGQLLVHLALLAARTVTAHGVLVGTAAVGVLLVTGLTAAGAEVYEAVAEGDGVAALDRPALDTVLTWRTSERNQLVTGFTDLGGVTGMSIIATVFTLGLTLAWRSRTPLVLMAIAVAGALLITSVGKELVGRLRPPLAEAVPPYESSPAFPSGHALNSTVIAGLLAYLVVRRLHRRLTRLLAVTIAMGWAVAMGLSRVFLGHHWLTDVMFGWLVGLAWLAVVITAHRLFLTVRRGRRAGAPGSTTVSR